MIGPKTVKESVSAVGRTRAEKPHGIVGLFKNPYVFMTCSFAALDCLMYGYDQGVMSSILVMENFQASFPQLMGSTIQGWLVSALELVAVIIFTIGTGLQAGAHKAAELFAGRVIGSFGSKFIVTFVLVHS